jgi:hypothetical protein
MDSLAIVALLGAWIETRVIAVIIMPIFEFTSPEGTKYHGEGATPEEAFRTAAELSPHEIAAMRTRQSVTHRPAPDIEIPEAARAVERGEYGPLIEAAGESAASLASTVAPGLSLLGQALSPTATAGGMFDAEPDPKVRRSLQRQYDEAGPKGKAEITKAFMDQQGKIAGEKRAAERETEARGLTKKTRDDWFAQNADAIKSLAPQRQQQITAAGSLPEAQEMFNRGMEERRQSSMTIAERYPSMVAGLEGAGMVGAAMLPAKLAAGRAGTIKRASDDAEEAFKAAWGPGSRANKGREADAGLAENILKRANQMHQFSGVEIGGGLAAPWIMGQMPNFFDMVMGQLSSDPGAQEKVERAWGNVLSLGPLERALIEGGAASFLGTWMGSGARDFGATKGRAQGVLDTFEGRRTAAAAATKAAADKKAAAIAARQPRPKPRIVENSSDVLAPDQGSVLNADFGGGYGH